MTRIGLISDTHGHMDDRILDYLSPCDEIWHAGDIGNGHVTSKLSAVCHLRAIHGNIDEPGIRKKYPENQVFEVEGLKIWMTHIGSLPPKYNRNIRAGISEICPDIFICGHSHIVRIIPDNEHHLLYLNPGAAGHQGFHKKRTLIRFSIDIGRIRDMQVIELGRRGLGNGDSGFPV